MHNRHFSLLLLLLLLPLPGVNTSAATTASVWTEMATTKIFRDTDLSATLHTVPKTSSSYSMTIAKGSSDAFQLVVTAGDNPVNGVNVQVSDLTGPATISADNIHIYLEYYVNVRTRTELESVVDYELGYYPDALIPLTDTFDVSANKNQPLWVEVSVPESTPAGNYSGTITLTGGVSASVPVNIEVLSFSLPRSSNLFNFAYLDTWELQDMYSDLPAAQVDQIILNYVKFFAEHDISAVDTIDIFDAPVKAGDSYDLQSWWDEILPVYQILDQYFDPLVLRIPVDLEVLGVDVEEASSSSAMDSYTQFLSQFKSFVREQNSLDVNNVVWYVWIDEFDEPQSADIAWLIAKYATLTDQVSSNDFYINYRIDGTIDWKSEAVQWDLDTDTSTWEDLSNSFSILQAPQEDFEFDPNFIQSSIEDGRKIISYQQAWSSFAPNDPELPPNADKSKKYEFPSVSGLVNPAVFSRVLPWIVWRYGAHGIGFWAIMAWYSSGVEGVLDMFVDDPALRLNVGLDAVPTIAENGDGFLVYPGNKVSAHSGQRSFDGPVSSIRLELFKKGLQDYKYIKLLEMNQKSLSGADSLLDKIRGYVQSMSSFERDPAVYDAIVHDIQDLLNGVTSLDTSIPEVDWTPLSGYSTPTGETPAVTTEDDSPLLSPAWLLVVALVISRRKSRIG